MTNYETRTAVWWAVQGVVTGAAGDAVERDSEHPVLEDFLCSASSGVV